MVDTAIPSDQVENNRDVKEGAKGVLQSLHRLFNQLGPIRLGSTILFMILALLVARFSWTTPMIQEAERALYDLRASVFAPEVDKDENIVMIVYNEDTLKLTGQRSPVDRTILAQALESIDAANPKSIGIDILFTMPQDDDELLISAFKNMETPTYLAYADPKENPEIAFAEHEFTEVTWREGESKQGKTIAGRYFTVRLPPSTMIRLDLGIARFTGQPSYAHPWHGGEVPVAMEHELAPS